jgi:hypothetical protein
MLTKDQVYLINEVRLPDGYFKVIKSFIVKLPNDEYDTIINRDAIIFIDTNNKMIKQWNKILGHWELFSIPYLTLMNQEFYIMFKQNTIKINSKDLNIPLEHITSSDEETNIGFITTVKGIQNRLAKLNLDASTKLKVAII